MMLDDALEHVSDRFVYQLDKALLTDAWFVMREQDGKMYGDCEDFALTVFWIMSGKSLLHFLWRVLITGEYELHGVKSNGSNAINHCVACYHGNWFDNWTKNEMNADYFFNKTAHVHGKKMSRFVIFSKLLFGYNYR